MIVKDNDVLKTELLVGEPLDGNIILEKFDNRVEPPLGLRCEHFSNVSILSYLLQSVLNRR
jgi:hypothetical protein